MENQQKVKIDLAGAPWAECCGGPQIFNISYMFKRVSALLSPTGREEFVPVEVVICGKCGKVPAFMSSKVPDIPADLCAKNEQ